MPLLRRSRWFAVPAFVVVAAFGNPPTHPAAEPVSANEIRRIHAHFDSVLIELRARDVSSLSVTQRTHRTALIATLASYNARAQFPQNYDFVAPTPYFIDRRTGVLCAVAHLLEFTGRRDIVDRIALSNNNVWVAALAGDSAVTTWVHTNGLTLDEAARIQVPYNSGPSPAMVGTIVIGLPLVVGSSLAAAVWNGWGNADGHRQSGRVIGMTAGILSLAIGGGIAAQMNSNDPHILPATMAAAGGLSIVMAARSMYRHHQIELASRDSSRANVTTPAYARISPILPLGRGTGAGVAVEIRF